MSTLYTFGYLSAKGERIISELLAVRTPIVDIRFSATSRRWQYNQEVMQNKLGNLYYHIVELGNERYKEALTGDYQEPHITLHKPDVGLARLARILEHYGRAAIFCACSSKKTCHRKLVAEMAQEKIAGLQVVHL